MWNVQMRTSAANCKGLRLCLISGWFAFLFFGPLSIARAQESKPLLLRHPSLSRTQVVFSYAGYLWIANRDGGEARQLTTGGHESDPIFSPEGTQIAFTGAYDGAGDVYVIPVSGGLPRRLTFHPSDEAVIGWSPDGKNVVFRSARLAFGSQDSQPVEQLYTVPVGGGFATAIPLVRAAEGSLSPDGSHIAYVPFTPWTPGWKRYRGGQTRPIWIANLKDSNTESRVPRQDSNDFNPMWVGDTIYFLSDRKGPVTLFAYATRTK